MFKSIEDAYSALIRYCNEPENPLFDFGCVILKEVDGNLVSSLCQSYHEDIETIDMMRPYTEDKPLVLNDELKEVYRYLQEESNKIRPRILWDELHFFVNSDQSLEIVYLFEGETVEPFSPPPQKEITFEYLSSLMFNNIKFYAPDNFCWLWEEINREKGLDGKTSYSADFYYSLTDDKDDPQFLKPKDTIFMINASEKLLDEFPQHDTMAWSKLVLFFSKSGELKYKVLENSFK